MSIMRVGQMKFPVCTALTVLSAVPVALGQNMPIPPDKFNVFSSQHVQYVDGGDVEGIVACGGNFIADGFSLHADGTAGPHTGVSLYAGGYVTFGAGTSGGQINHGGIEAAGDIYLQNSATFGSLSGGGDCTLNQGQIHGDVVCEGVFTGSPLDVSGSIQENVPFTPSIDLGAYRNYYENISVAYGNMPDNVTWINDYGNIRVQMHPGVNVMSINLSAIAPGEVHSFTVDGPPGSLLVVNVPGHLVRLFSISWVLSGGVERADIAINCFEALRGTVMGGEHVTLISPFAMVVFRHGLLSGNLIVNNLRGSGQVNSNPWRGFGSCTGKIGDYVWLDLDGGGVQDGLEPGVEGIRVNLTDADNNPLESVVTDQNGYYEFNSLCAGDYLVSVDESTVPEGMVASPCEAGSDVTIDSNCSPTAVTLPDNNSIREDIDFGYIPVPFVSCDSLPNSTGLEARIDYSGSTSITTNDFQFEISDLPPNKPAYLFYGRDQANEPFGDGVLCIGSPIFRYKKIPTTGPTGIVTVPLDFTQPPLNGGVGQILPGVPHYFQLWYRDPLGGPEGFNATGGMCVTFAP